MSLASDRTGRRDRGRGARTDAGGPTRQNTNLAAAVDIAMVVVIVRATLTRSDGACGAYAAAPGTAAAPTLKPAAGRADGEIRSVRVSGCLVDVVCGVKSIPRGSKTRRFHRRERASKGAFDRLDPGDGRSPRRRSRSADSIRHLAARERKPFHRPWLSVRERARGTLVRGPVGGAGLPVVMDFGAMLEGYRFGAAGSPPPRPAPLGGDRSGHARPCAPRDVVDPSDDSSWHVSESLDGDDAADDAGAVESERASSPSRGVKRDAPDGPPDPDDDRHPDPSRDGTDGTATRTPLSYGDAVDLDRAAAASATTSTSASDASRRFFLPRGHPARPPTRPRIVGASRSNASATRDRAAPHP